MDANTASVLVAAIAAIASTISIVVSTRAQTIAKGTKEDVREIHHMVNDRLTQLLTSRTAQAFAEGQIEGRAVEKQHADGREGAPGGPARTKPT